MRLVEQEIVIDAAGNVAIEWVEPEASDLVKALAESMGDDKQREHYRPVIVGGKVHDGNIYCG